MTEDPKASIYQQAAEAIRKNDVERLSSLLSRHPQLAVAPGPDGPRLLGECLSYANYAGENPAFWNRPDCARALLDAGAEVRPEDRERALVTASNNMVALFVERGAMPKDLRALAALGDIDGVRERFDAGSVQSSEVDDAFRTACRFGREEIAGHLLERAIAARPELAERFREPEARGRLIADLIEHRGELDMGRIENPWILKRRLDLRRAAEANDLEAFRTVLRDVPALLDHDAIDVQRGILELCAYGNRPAIIKALLEAGAAIAVPPVGECFGLRYAIDYGNREVIDLLLPHWDPEPDLPTMAGLGRMEEVRRFFAETSESALGPTLVYPEQTEVEDPGRIVQHAFGLACMNEQFEVASFLLEEGADVNGAWGLHEPATVLHEAAASGKLATVRFLVERGADTTIRDERFGATAAEWAAHTEHRRIEAFLSGDKDPPPS